MMAIALPCMSALKSQIGRIKFRQLIYCPINESETFMLSKLSDEEHLVHLAAFGLCVPFCLGLSVMGFLSFVELFEQGSNHADHV